MNVALGGSLHQDIEHHWQDKPSDYLTMRIVDENSKLAEIPLGSETLSTPSTISIKHLASDLRVTVRDPEDNTVEGGVSQSRPSLSWYSGILLTNVKKAQTL